MTKLDEIISKIPNLGHFLSSAQGFDVIKSIALEYAEWCCEQQKIICSENAEAEFEPMGWLADQHFNTPFIVGEDYEVPIIRSSILNCPTYKEEDGK